MPGSGAQAYGAFPSAENSAPKGPFLRYPRKRINWVPIAVCIALPCAMFSGVFFALSSPIRSDQPEMCYLLVGCAFLITVAVCAYSAWLKLYRSGEREPSWMIFLAVSLLIAFIAALFGGQSNYSTNVTPGEDLKGMSSYSNVNAANMRGQQMMDAGSLTFAAGTHLDLTRSMGFKNSRTYCIAPIVMGDVPLATYDFWAVGTDCCSSNAADFHCEGFNDPRPHKGIRLTNDDDRVFYRLAVQQAEAAYGLRAVHPLFFSWIPDEKRAGPRATALLAVPGAAGAAGAPGAGESNALAETVDSFQVSASNNLLMGIIAFCVFQVFITLVATAVFSKLGSL